MMLRRATNQNNLVHSFGGKIKRNAESMLLFSLSKGFDGLKYKYVIYHYAVYWMNYTL